MHRHRHLNTSPISTLYNVVLVYTPFAMRYVNFSILSHFECVLGGSFCGILQRSRCNTLIVWCYRRTYLNAIHELNTLFCRWCCLHPSTFTSILYCLWSHLPFVDIRIFLIFHFRSHRSFTTIENVVTELLHGGSAYCHCRLNCNFTNLRPKRNEHPNIVKRHRCGWVGMNVVVS